MKHNIIYLIDGLGVGGAERMMIPVLRHLSRKDFEPRVCVLQEKEGNPIAEDLRQLGIPVDWLPVSHLRDLTAVPRIIKYLRDAKTDLVHTQLEFSNVLGSIAAWAVRLPRVCTIHVLPSLEANPKTGLHQRFEAFVLRNFCDRVIAVSEEARQLHLASTGASPSQVITIYNGIDLDNYSAIDRLKERAAVRRELSIPPDAKVLVTVAVLRPAKGIEHMLRAFPSVLQANPDTYYLIVGGGPCYEDLVDQAARSGLGERVVFSGMRSDVPRLLAASDLFVLPTLTEALPTVLAEAMAAHLPIVATAVGGIPEMIVDGRNGQLVRPGDEEALGRACNEILSDPVSIVGLGRSSWEIVNEKFSIQQQVDKLKGLYLGLIDRHVRA